MTASFELNLETVCYYYFDMNLSLKEVAARCNCSANKVSETLTKAGFSLRARGRSRLPIDERALMETAKQTKIVGFSEKKLKIFEKVKKRVTPGQFNQFEMIASYDLKAAIRYYRVVRRNYVISI